MITGRCECAKVKYQVAGELKDFCHCHCSICRRIHGAAFATWGEISRGEFTYLSGENDLKTYAFSERADSIFLWHLWINDLGRFQVGSRHALHHLGYCRWRREVPSGLPSICRLEGSLVRNH